MAIEAQLDINPDPGFWVWMNKVDNIIYDVAGVGLYDLPDMDYAVAYEEGVDPEDMANEALEYAGYPGVEG